MIPSDPADVLVVGAGPAGLTAALVLGRMRRHVLVVDADDPAHAVSEAVHGFLGQDGTPPRELRRVGREQLQAYPAVELRRATARSARRAVDGTFELALDAGRQVTGRRLLLAHGMRYGLPDLDGVAELWGTRVFHCPYCHGWEARERPLAVYGCGERAVHQALLLASLSDDVVLLCRSGSALAGGRREQLTAAGIDVRGERATAVETCGAGMRIVLDGHPPIERDAMFVQPALSLAADLGPALGAELTDAGTIRVDQTGQTSIGGLYAAGDAATPVQSVAVATGSGARAAYAINAGLAAEPTRTEGP
jgi:thioredoxin reductase